MAGYARAFLGPRTWAQSQPKPWNFAVTGGGVDPQNNYSVIGALTPMLPCPGVQTGGTPHWPSNTNQLCGIINGTTLMTESGWYDFALGTNGSYTSSPSGISTVFSTVTVGGVCYVLYAQGSSAANKFGSTTDGKTITLIGAVPDPVAGVVTVGNNPTRLQFDGTKIVFANIFTLSGSTRLYWETTADLGVTWVPSTQNVAVSGSFSKGWIDYAGNQYLYYNSSVLRVSTDYFSTSSVLPTTNLTNAGITWNGECIPMADGVRVLLQNDSAQATVIHVDNSAADILLAGAGNGYFPCVDSDRATIYAYDGGILSSTDFSAWTRLTTESFPTGKLATFKQSQCIN